MATIPDDTGRFCVLMLNANPGLMVVDIQRALSADGYDWCRIAANVWLLHTGRSPQDVGSVAELAKPCGTYFLSRLDLREFDACNGLLDPAAWAWIRERLRAAAAAATSDTPEKDPS